MNTIGMTGAALLLGIATCCATTFGEVPKPVDKPVRDRIAYLIDNITAIEEIDPLSRGYTPAVWELIKIGEPAMEPLLDLMESGSGKATHNTLTGEAYDRELDAKSRRACAHKALFGIADDLYGGHLETKREDLEAQFKWQKTWTSLGDYDEEAALDERRAVVKKWRDWIRSHPRAGAAP